MAITRSAVAVLSLIAVISAEAPYSLPRPSFNQPQFGYPSGLRPQPLPSLPQPAPAPSRPLPVIPQYPQQQFRPSSGYSYPQPNLPAVQLQPQPQYQPQPQPLPQLQPQPQPRPSPQLQPLPQPPPPPHTQSLPQLQYQPQPQYQPQLQYQPHLQYQRQPSFPAPQPSYPQPTIPLSASYGIPQYQLPQIQIQPHPQPQPFLQYQPQLQFPLQPQPQLQYQPQPQPQLQTQLQPLPSLSQAQFGLQGYNYQQSQPQLLTNLGSSGLSSYEADSNQYSQYLGQNLLDSTVVDRVQNIIRDNEHTSAKNAGYVSLVSGVSLESARPSIELTSFVSNSPATSAGQGSVQAQTSSQSSGDLSVSAPLIEYSQPQISIQSAQSDSSLAFLPSSQPATSYGALQSK